MPEIPGLPTGLIFVGLLVYVMIITVVSWVS